MAEQPMGQMMRRQIVTAFSNRRSHAASDSGRMDRSSDITERCCSEAAVAARDTAPTNTATTKATTRHSMQTQQGAHRVGRQAADMIIQFHDAVGGHQHRKARQAVEPDEELIVDGLLYGVFVSR